MRHRDQQVCLVRHGQTEWSITGRHTGTTDIALTAQGRAAATLLRSVLHGRTFAAVLVSPLRRARETCTLAGFGAVASVEADLREWDYGEYEGLTPEQIEERAPGWAVFRDGSPGGESPTEVGTRVDRLIERIRAIDGDVALFAHGHILRVLAARWIGLPVSGGSHFLLDTARLGVLGFYHGVGAIEQWNAGSPQGRMQAQARRA